MRPRRALVRAAQAPGLAARPLGRGVSRSAFLSVPLYRHLKKRRSPAQRGPSTGLRCGAMRQHGGVGITGRPPSDAPATAPEVPGLKLRAPLLVGYFITVVTHWGNSEGLGGAATDWSIFAASQTAFTVRRGRERSEEPRSRAASSRAAWALAAPLLPVGRALQRRNALLCRTRRLRLAAGAVHASGPQRVVPSFCAEPC